jgi:hypothetical protein
VPGRATARDARDSLGGVNFIGAILVGGGVGIGTGFAIAWWRRRRERDTGDLDY